MSTVVWASFALERWHGSLYHTALVAPGSITVVSGKALAFGGHATCTEPAASALSLIDPTAAL